MSPFPVVLGPTNPRTVLVHVSPGQVTFTGSQFLCHSSVSLPALLVVCHRSYLTGAIYARLVRWNANLRSNYPEYTKYWKEKILLFISVITWQSPSTCHYINYTLIINSSGRTDKSGPNLRLYIGLIK